MPTVPRWHEVREADWQPDELTRAWHDILPLEDETLRVAAMRCSDTELHVMLVDGRTISTPLWWYPRLLAATPGQRAAHEIMPLGIHWAGIDEDLGISGMLKGTKAPGRREAADGQPCPSRRSFARRPSGAPGSPRTSIPVF